MFRRPTTAELFKGCKAKPVTTTVYQFDRDDLRWALALVLGVPMEDVAIEFTLSGGGGNGLVGLGVQGWTTNTIPLGVTGVRVTVSHKDEPVKPAE